MERKKSRVTTILLSVLLVLMVCLVGIGIFAFLRYQKTSSYNEKLSLGDKYLKEEKYEDAILAYSDAINIDKKKSQGYFSLSNVYLAANDFENAKVVLESGKEYIKQELYDEKMQNIEEEKIKSEEVIPEPTIEPTPEPTEEAEEKSPYKAYQEVVAQYEAQYGQAGHGFLQVYGSTEIMTGTFLVRLIDFNQDGVEELLIGYGVEGLLIGYGVDNNLTIENYYADIWVYKDGTATQEYHGEAVTASDIGRSIMYTWHDGQYYMMTGMRGYEDSMEYYALQDGTFNCVRKVERRYDTPSSIDGVQMSEQECFEQMSAWEQNTTYIYCLGNNGMEETLNETASVKRKLEE